MRGWVLLVCAAAFGQDEQPLFKSDAPLVELHATVSDRQGRLITGLPESAFHVFENDAPQQIKVFRQEDAPVSLGLIVDNSASMRDKRARVAAALAAMVRASNPGDEEFVVNFNQTPALALDFTHDAARLEAALATLDSNGETALRDALDFGIEHVSRLGKADKKALVIVTDGEDNSSVVTLARVTRAAQQSGVLIYAIGLLSDGNEREAARARRDLDAVTSASGGRAFYPNDVSEVDAIANQVAHELRNQYTIAYSPSNGRRDGTYRRIRVTVDAQPDTVVKTRNGYYASADALPRDIELPHCDATKTSDSDPVHGDFCGGGPAGGGNRQNPDQ
jgi:VWFA-related protein